MEQLPNWLTDAVAAAGLATVYADNFDAMIEKGVVKTDAASDEGSSASH